ncbi:ABC transporter ATP-binding protein [Microbacterium sp. 18062]|uniref:ABC transporter ATP-binding protein n=1 Tax=Microbacterium sp. 18062 TaxID=2681410 RepID=UPI0013592080|nr:ATP-binding cassette domain-containing protein [Microbacterium sp. 18062]
MPSVEITGASVSLGGRAILDHATARIDGPATVAIMGPSGAGKTTLLYTIAGLIRPQEGSVTLIGGAGQAPAWVVQNSPLLARRTALENVALGASAVGVEWHAAQEAAAPIMTALSIEHLALRPAYQLSGGERQRVAVARAIALRAPLILADEPTASLDSSSRAAVCDALERAAAAGALVLVTTHDPVVADRADRILALAEGQIREASA